MPSSPPLAMIMQNDDREAILEEEARALWIKSYPHLTRDRDGKGGNLLARSEVYARMLAMVFASMDGRRGIEPCDLRAAIAWVEYWHASVTYTFNCADQEDGLTLALRCSRLLPGNQVSP